MSFRCCCVFFAVGPFGVRCVARLLFAVVVDVIVVFHMFVFVVCVCVFV